MSFLSRKITDVLIDQMQKPRKGKQGEVHLPGFLGILGAVCAIPFLIFAVISFLKEALGAALCFLLLASLGGSMVVAYLNCRIIYDDSGFVARNFLGIRGRFTYDRITGIKRNVNETFLYVGKRRYMVDGIAVGGGEFLLFAAKQYRTLNNGRSIPSIQNTKRDLFHGNVESSGEFLFAYILMGVVCVGFLIFMAFEVFLPSNPGNTIEQKVCFTSCQVKEDRIHFRSEDQKLYKISFFDEKIDLQEMDRLCDGESLLTVYGKEYTPDDGEDYFEIKAIYHNDDEILSFSDTNRLHRQEFWPLLLIGLLFCLIWGAYVVGSVIVGRNPKRYSKKTLKLFFKDGYVKY